MGDLWGMVDEGDGQGACVKKRKEAQSRQAKDTSSETGE